MNLHEFVLLEKVPESAGERQSLEIEKKKLEFKI